MADMVYMHLSCSKCGENLGFSSPEIGSMTAAGQYTLALNVDPCFCYDPEEDD